MAEDMFPKPSIARMVHFNDGGECLAAIVTKVDDMKEEKVSLTVIPPLSPTWIVPYVPRGTDSNTWHWPERVD